MMIRIVALFLILQCASAQAESSFQSEEELGRWITYYYQNPEPDRFVSAVAYLARSGTLEKQSSIPPIFGFIAGVMGANPDRIGGWLKEFGYLNDSQLSTIALGVWYAQQSQSQETVYELLEKRQGLKERLRFVLDGSPISITDIPLEQGTWVLDANWGYFMATGDKRPILRVISALPWQDVKGDIGKLMVGGAARWSLTSNAVQHTTVLRICEEVAPQQSPEVSAKLVQVINEAKKELGGA